VTPNLTADHSANHLGRTPSRPEDLAKVPRVSAIVGEGELPEAPAVIDNLSCLSRIDMQGNDEAGDCFYAAVAKLIQAQTAIMGKERIFTTEEVLAMYSRDTGFVRGRPDTDNGTNMYDGLQACVQKGFCEIEVEGFALLDATDFKKVHQANWIGGGTLWATDLPLIAKRQHRWRLEMGQGDELITPGGWGGHCVSQAKSVILPNGLSDETVLTWGAPLGVDQTYRDGGYVPEIYVLWIKGFTPKIRGFDHARFLSAIREVRL
jgi:hypothetical protein